MNNRTLTLGSLFDGSGGFPLGATRHGIKPVWASEIEPDPIRVTRKNFPEMKHYGDITAINGADLEPVDIIALGSPCQSLSRAGSRAGLNGGESKLFFEGIRVIKEMRDSTNGKYPRFVVWENVPNAFSSEQGEDFRQILEEYVRIKDPDIAIPRPQEKWGHAGAIVGNGFSLAWRLLNSQYWGVPQRRKRIYLICDFGGESAPEILFKPEVRCWDSPKNGEEGKTSPASSDSGAGGCANGVYPLNYYPNDSRLRFEHTNVVQTLTARMGTGGNNVPMVLLASEHTNAEMSETVCPTLLHAHVQPIMAYEDEGVPRIRKLTPLECCRLQGFPDDWCDGVEIEDPTDEEITFWHDVLALVGKERERKSIVQWLRKPMSNTARYKMWGNGVALPCVERVMWGIEDYING